MFEFIRKHLKLVMMIFFPLVIIAFVFVGVDASMLTQRSPVVARVGGTDITQVQWDNVHRQMADQARAGNPNLTSAMLDSPEQKYAVLERMVRDEVYRTAMQDKRYVVSDSELARTLASDPEIAKLRTADGSLDMNAYREWVASRYRTTPEGFENSMRYQLALQQVVGTVQESSISTPAQSAPTLNAVYQRRAVQLAEFLPVNYEKEVVVTDEKLSAFYQQNSALFQQSEQVDVQYLLLDLDSVAANIDVSDAELHQYYESNKQSYTRSPEQRKARHILINTNNDMSASEREAARSKAEQLHAQVVADPGSFAEVAKENSQDTGSKTSGGDLGFFGRGAMVPAFDEAAFKLEKDAISDVIATEYGFHIIQVTDITPADIPSFEEIKDRIAKDVKNTLARNQFIEAADQLRNITHEQPDSLEPAATELKLPILTAEGISRTLDDKTPAALNHTEVLQELFSTKLLEDEYNSDAIDIGNNQIVAARVVKHYPARLLPLDEVTEKVNELFRSQEAARLATEAGQAALQALKEGKDVSVDLQPETHLSRVETNGLDAEVIKKIMLVPQTQLPVYEGIAQTGKSYLLVKINGIAKDDLGEGTEAIQAMRAQDYSQSLALAETEAYYESLKQQYKAQIRVTRPN